MTQVTTPGEPGVTHGFGAKDLVRRAKEIQAGAAAVVAGANQASARVASAVRALPTHMPDGDSGAVLMCRVDLGAGNSGVDALVAAARCEERLVRDLGAQLDLARRVAKELSAPIKDAKAATGRVRFLLSGSKRRDKATGAIDHLHRYTAWAEENRVPETLDAALAAQQPSVADAADGAADVQQRPQWYYRRLAAALDADPDVAAGTLLPAIDVRRATELARLAQPMATAVARSRDAVVPAFHELRAAMVRRDLAKMPVARLKDATTGRLRLNVIASAGYATVLDVMEASVSRLQAIDGVGPQTAMQAHAAAQQVARAVDDDLKFRIDLDPSDRLSTVLVQALYRWGQLHRALAGLEDELEECARELRALTTVPEPAAGLVGLIAGGRTGARLTPALVLDRLAWADASAVWSRLRTASQVAGGDVEAGIAWEDFERRPADYYALLGQLVDLKPDVEAAEGYLPEEIIARVRDQPLDESLSTVSLRGYQSFGARFALVQRRVIIGDEMGLGKTIQATAAMSHLKATGSKHFLVVCPASVLINWVREVRKRTRLDAYQLHGVDRVVSLRRWIERGDVAVTTFESLKHLDLPTKLRPAMLVVDEAHYVKNPTAQRSVRVAAAVARADRVLFLTGTPMENRVEEFRNLVTYLQPDLAPRVEARAAIVGPGAFRTAVAPVYLRRNTEDVLAELPELVQVDEWEEFGSADLAAYRTAVAQGNFMAMRRAAFAGASPAASPKLQRLLEIADEAGDNGHKVIVFSYFRDVLTTVYRVLGPRAFGPLTGDVPAGKRQALVDAFSQADGHAVLVSQIQAGGVGLNMQAASVVILCEPQDSVDQRMLEILDSKTRLFDEYVRRSDIADSSPEAVDISEGVLARDVVAKEQERLALATMAELASPPDD